MNKLIEAMERNMIEFEAVLHSPSKDKSEISWNHTKSQKRLLLAMREMIEGEKSVHFHTGICETDKFSCDGIQEKISIENNIIDSLLSAIDEALNGK